MKKLYATIGKIIFYLFVVAVFAWTASLTLGEMKQILPNDPITPYFALALFDIGAIAWLFAWMGHARGLMQRSIAAIMLILDLAGVVLLSAGRLLSGGQTMTDVPTSLSSAVIYGVVFATLANLAAIYAFHITDPDTMEDIETGLLTDTLRAEAQKQATANIESEAQALGAIMAARATGQLKYNLRLPMSTRESAQVIDAQAQDVTPPSPTTSEAKQPVNLGVLWSGLVNAATGKSAKVTAPAVVPDPKPQEELHYHPMSAPIQQEAKPKRETAPAIFRGDPIFFNSKVERQFGKYHVAIDAPQQAILCEDGLYNLSDEGADMAAARITADDLAILQNGEVTEATAETKQAMSEAARTAWLHDNSGTAPADETPNPTRPEEGLNDLPLSQWIG